MKNLLNWQVYAPLHPSCSWNRLESDIQGFLEKRFLHFPMRSGLHFCPHWTISAAIMAISSFSPWNFKQGNIEHKHTIHLPLNQTPSTSNHPKAHHLNMDVNKILFSRLQNRLTLDHCRCLKKLSLLWKMWKMSPKVVRYEAFQCLIICFPFPIRK